MNEIETLVAQLDDPRTRRMARRKLVNTRAVAPLLECLSSLSEPVVWSAVRSLGELRAQEAIQPLVEMLQNGVLVFDVCEALTKITGQDFGLDITKWISLKANEYSELNVAECVQRTGEYLGVEPSGAGQKFTFRLDTDDDRSQQVITYFGHSGPSGEKLVVIYSECGPANPKYYETMLRNNMVVPAGAFAIRDVDETPNFVMVDTMIAESVTPSVLAQKIENIANRSDAIEKGLSKQDQC